MVQDKVSVEGFNNSQLKFTISVMALVMDKLIQDDMELDENAMPLPVAQQSDPTIKQAMTILNYD